MPLLLNILLLRTNGHLGTRPYSSLPSGQILYLWRIAELLLLLAADYSEEKEQ